MRLTGKKKLAKLCRKNRGNAKLIQEIEKLIEDIEKSHWTNEFELKKLRKDADRVHEDGFYFFDLQIHRSMILIEFEDQEATVVWAGSHDEYETIFKNNKKVIEKWLRRNEYI